MRDEENISENPSPSPLTISASAPQLLATAPALQLIHPFISRAILGSNTLLYLPSTSVLAFALRSKRSSLSRFDVEARRRAPLIPTLYGPSASSPLHPSLHPPAVLGNSWIASLPTSRQRSVAAAARLHPL